MVNKARYFGSTLNSRDNDHKIDRETSICDVLPISSGLGLTIANSIINEIGGNGLEITSTHGVGTEVSFTLDLIVKTQRH
jgi:signal transduction histidine kinase